MAGTRPSEVKELRKWPCFGCGTCLPRHLGPHNSEHRHFQGSFRPKSPHNNIHPSPPHFCINAFSVTLCLALRPKHNSANMHANPPLHPRLPFVNNTIFENTRKPRCKQSNNTNSQHRVHHKHMQQQADLSLTVRACGWPNAGALTNLGMPASTRRSMASLSGPRLLPAND
jgi:hypothetical protein